MKNSISTTHPLLAQEWNDTKEISTITAGSGYKAQWQCHQCQGTWKAAVYSRAKNNRGCPYCSGRLPLPGVNDLATTHPHLIKEWSSKNKKKPEEVSYGSSNTKYGWECSIGHYWETTVANRTRAGSNCPVCANKSIIVGETDLATTHPHLIQEWDDDREITTVSAGSHFKARWKCKFGHRWETAVRNRALKNRKCLACIGQQVIVGETDLATTHPLIASEWDDLRKLPTEVSAGSNFKAQWKCEKGHQWQTIIALRTRIKNATQCPKCVSGQRSSKAETEIYQYIHSIVPEDTIVERNNRELIGKELDIYIPSMNFAIEYNGLYWNSEAGGKDKDYHYQKFKACQEKGVQLIQVWEDDFQLKKELILKMLSYKLNADSLGCEKLAARKTVCERISSEESMIFLENNHLQGGSLISKHYGLKDKFTHEIVAVMSVKFNKKNNSLEISRFASAKNVQGGFSKLLAHIIKDQKNTIDEVVSYSHNDHSWGQVYAKNGFTKVHDGTPGYFYIKNNRREHRLGFSISQFKKRSDLVFQENKTEKELAELNGLIRIWDAGSALWKRAL